MTATEERTVHSALADLPVCDEFPVQLELNGERVVTLLCTPSGLTELAVGWLYCEGLVEGADEILAVGACDGLSRMRVHTDAERPLVQSEWRRVITSGCGSGHAIDPAELAKLPPVTGDYTFPLPRLEELMREVALGGPLKRAVGGVHSAALIDEGGILAHYEDVGRHNAVDKCIGRALLTGIDLGCVVLCATGRVSSEMAFKASRCGIPIVASLNSTTSLAVELARHAGVTIVAKAIGRKRLVYTRPDRITQIDESKWGE
ncbi:MAG: formate dehydrogenase accessory sulfurtransferase FdhD [Chloroflexota bacterium]|nr:formate dehydrogenase accessory sulfurtransferase FdhD [Chloroflexota bacterium]